MLLSVKEQNELGNSTFIRCLKHKQFGARVCEFRITNHLLCYASGVGAANSLPFPVSFTWASHVAAYVLTGRYTLPNQSITNHACARVRTFHVGLRFAPTCWYVCFKHAIKTCHWGMYSLFTLRRTRSPLRASS